MPLTDETRVAAREIVARYPRPRSALLPMLHLVQSEEGYVTPEGVRFCAEELGLTKAEVGAVATFYTMYKRRPTGDYLVSVCTNTLCDVLGGQEIYETLSEQLGVGHDQTTADGRITLEHAECLAACDYAPVVTVNYEFFDQQTPESATRAGRRAAGGPAAAADPGRAAVHVQGDQPAAGRVRRRAAGRGRRRVGRRADADRRPAGGAAGGDGARVRRADPARQAGRTRGLEPAPAAPARRGGRAGRAAPASAGGEARRRRTAAEHRGRAVGRRRHRPSTAGRRTSRPAAPARACRPRPPTPRPTRARTRSPSRLTASSARSRRAHRNRSPVPPRTGRRPPTAGARSGARRAEPCR